MGKFDYITSDTIIDTMGHPIFSQTQWPASKCPFNLLTYPYFSGAAIPANEPAGPGKKHATKMLQNMFHAWLVDLFSR